MSHAQMVRENVAKFAQEWTVRLLQRRGRAPFLVQKLDPRLRFELLEKGCLITTPIQLDQSELVRDRNQRTAVVQLLRRKTRRALANARRFAKQRNLEILTVSVSPFTEDWLSRATVSALRMLVVPRSEPIQGPLIPYSQHFDLPKGACDETALCAG